MATSHHAHDLQLHECRKGEAMKLLKMVLFAAFVPTVAFAQAQPSQETDTNQDTPKTDTYKSDQGTTDMSKPFGLTVKPLTEDQRSSYGAKEGGLLVTKVESGSPADKAGVKVGDVVTKINDTALASNDDLTKALKQGEKAEHGQVSIEIVRDHQTKDLKATLQPKSSMQPDTMD
jgi:S1-C subfamily serine protease